MAHLHALGFGACKYIFCIMQLMNKIYHLSTPGEKEIHMYYSYALLLLCIMQIKWACTVCMPGSRASLTSAHHHNSCINPLYTNRFFIMIKYNVLEIAYCTYLGVSGYNLKKYCILLSEDLFLPWHTV